jgi:hypothetical protein
MVTRGIKRTALLCAMAVVSVNIWTGSPLLAVWVGSKVQGEGSATMLPFAVVAAMLFALSIGLVVLLGRLGESYDALVGRRVRRRQAPWMRSMRGERPHQPAAAERASALDKVLVVAVVLAVAAFEVWFFFFSGSPIGGPSGR